MDKRIAFLSLLLLSLTTFLPQRAVASHIMGGEINYYCINNCTIEVELRVYRDCSGSPSISPNSFSFVAQTPGCGQPTALGGWPAQPTITEVTPICNTFQTQCQTPGAQINGVEEYYWTRQYDICSQPNCIYTMQWTTCCRNPAITSLINPGSQSMFIGSTTLNTGITPCNNSPTFANPPVPYLCQGQPYIFNQGATDPEGDSLAYSLGPCYTTSLANQVPYAAGYSPMAPLGPSWNVTINPTTGDITVLPNPTGNIVVGVLCVYVEEWRNGQLLNTIVRDIQMTVIPCPNNTLPTIPSVTNVNGGNATGNYEVTVCAGTPLSFDLPSVDPDAGQTHTVFWNQNLAALGATFGLGAQQDTVTGPTPTAQFTWTPQNTGVYTFLVTVQDDACPITGQNQFTITINVQGGLPGAAITATPTGCTNVSLNANPGTGNTGPYTYQWFGDGNLNINQNNTNQNLNHTFPGPGTYEVNVQITDAFGCVSILTDTVFIPNGPTANAGPNIAMCSGYSIQLGAPAIPGQTYTWFPTTGLNNPTAPDPTFTYNVTGNSPDTLNFMLSATEGFCTAIDYVTVIVYPTPVANITGINQICIGDQTTLTASGGTSYLWSTGDVTPSITVSPTATTTYTVTAINNGCASLPAQFTVEVTTGPSSVITGVDSVCSGGSVTLTAAGGTSWQWNTGATTQTITVNNIYQDTTVILIASDQGCPGPPSTFTIHVHESPSADFSSTEVCLGDPTDFSDLTVLNAGSLIGWTWTFDDPLSGQNNTSTSQNPSHIFTAPGTYQVQMIVTGYNGCRDTVIHPVVVNPLPAPDFTTENVCDGEEMYFTDQSTANAGIAAWAWDFGTPGGSSTQQNPVYTFPGPGTYNVTLTVTDNNGCVNSKTRTVLVHPNPVAEFSWDHKCHNTITEFTSSSYLVDPLGTTLDAHSWNFGDPASGADNFSTQVNPVHNYPGPGTYNVTLTVTTSQGCTNTLIIPVEVPVSPQPVVQWDTICSGYSATLAVTYVPPGMELEWFYSQNATEPFQVGNPVFQTPPLVLTTTYWVALRDEDGCLSPKTAVRAVVNDEAAIYVTVNSNVLELPNAVAEFTAVVDRNGPVVSWFWEFGDGSSSGLQSPVHEYTEEGVYTVTLVVINENGCVSSYTFEELIEVTADEQLYIPNAFTPNGDGLNDEFTVAGKLITDFEIKVFDRWGKLIYMSETQNFAWNGQDSKGQPVSEGAYTYVINAVTWTGRKIQRAGTITVIR